jgi:transposase
MDPALVSIQNAGNGFALSRPTIKEIFLFEKWNKSVAIPSNPTRKQRHNDDRRLYQYQAHHLIENFFNKLEPAPAVAKRYDKTAGHFLRAIHLAATVVWLN